MSHFFFTFFICNTNSAIAHFKIIWTYEMLTRITFSVLSIMYFVIPQFVQHHNNIFISLFNVLYSTCDKASEIYWNQSYFSTDRFFFIVFLPSDRYLLLSIINRLCYHMYNKSLKGGSSPSKKRFLYLLHRKPFRNKENCFLLNLKSYFCSQDINCFVLTFWECRNKRLDWKEKVNSKIYDVTGWLTKNYNTHINQ